MPPKDSIPELSALEMLEARIAPASLSMGSDGTGSLSLDGVSQGAVGGGATHGSALITGSGFLNITGAGALPFGDPEIVSASELHFRDADGDNVTVKFSRKILDDQNIDEVFHFTESGVGHVLDSIDFSKLADPKKARNTGIEITVEKSSGHADSDGIVEVGAILSQGTDLGKVSIEGSLGRIVAGDGKGSGLKSLSVQTLGSEEALIATDIENFASLISGRLGTLHVEKDILGAALWVRGANAQLKTIEVGGSLVGGLDDLSGTIVVDDKIGSATFGGDIAGGAGEHSGKLHSDESIAKLSIAGTVRGGDGDSSGRVEAFGAFGKVSIGAVAGGGGKLSGVVMGDFKFPDQNTPRTVGEGENSGQIVNGSAAGSLPGHNYDKPKPPKPGHQTICSCSFDGELTQWVNEPFTTPWGETLKRITPTYVAGGMIVSLANTIPPSNFSNDGAIYAKQALPGLGSADLIKAKKVKRG